jgi:hypothetical protein
VIIENMMAIHVLVALKMFNSDNELFGSDSD